MGRLLRGLLARRGSTSLLLALTVVAATAAAAAPAYEQAARTSILRSTLASAQPLAGELEVAKAVVTPTDPAAAGAAVQQVLGSLPGLAAPVLAYETLYDQPQPAVTGQPQAPPTQYPLVYRTGSCAAVKLLSGRCPTKLGEVMQDALDPSYHHGNRIGPLTVVGTYAVPTFGDPAFFGRYDEYFKPFGPDALFATAATADRYGTAGFVVADIAVDTNRISASELAADDRAVDRVLASPTLAEQQFTSVSLLDQTVVAVHQGWSSLAVPTVLATAQLLLLVWLLLSLVVVDDIEARAPEVALAKLRGLRPGSVLLVAVREPLLVLAAAIPIGALLGLVVAHLLAHADLLPGTPVGLPWLSWVAALGAVLGGVAAVLGGARRVRRRGVLEQWRRTTRETPKRAWVVDAVLLTAAAAGLGELAATGAIGSSSHGLEVEIVPGLIALAASVVLSRLLPPACRRLARLTARRGPLAPYLALRQVGRRSGGTRTTIVLASAIAIGLFGVAAFSVGTANRARVAAATVGAATVLTVSPPPGVDLGAIVDRVDPSGRRAVAVDLATEGTGNVVLAVQPARFAAVAAWTSPVAAAAAARRLQPPTPAPTVLTGTALRLVFAAPYPTRDVELTAAVSTGGGFLLPTLARTGPATFTTTLANCPCTLGGLELGGKTGLSGTTVLTALQQRTAAGWVAVPGAATRFAVPPESAGLETVHQTAAGLRWTYSVPQGADAPLLPTDQVDPLPAIAASPVASVGEGTPATGLDGQELLVDPIAVSAALPGAPAEGLVVDRTLALRASGGANTGRQQVWLTAAGRSLIPALQLAGVQIDGTQTVAALRASYDRAGPALASSVLLLDAVLAAVLAVLGATVVLLVAARRRRYEYASLLVGGAGRATLWRTIVLEQAITSGFALLVGVGAGVVGIVLAVRKVPVLQTAPAAPPLDFAPHLEPMVLAVLVAVGLIAASAVLAATALVRSVRPGTLRETQP